ncbi:MAG: HNH endonuclease [Actinobacteria bacterium]|nr:HNH endonuclease [Actinomycetota bacterium]
MPLPKGIKMSEESKLKMSLAHKGKKHSKETREKIKQSNTGKLHSEECKKKMSQKRIGKYLRENNPAWIGGRTNHGQGYICIFKPEHPDSNSCGYVLEHRIIMEEAIGRYLEPDEIVHHINGDKKDNRIENLLLFASQKEHASFHKNLNNI